jgi:hypothetical protein
VRPVPHGTGASGRSPRGAERGEGLIGRAARSIAVGALWTPTGRRVQRVRSDGEACLITATATYDAHCSHLSCSDQTHPVTLTGAFGQHVLQCVIR